MLNQLRQLPRDSRDTLFLLLVIGWLVLPQFAHLPLWCSLFAAGLALWRAWLALKARALPSRWWLAALLLVTLVATYATYKTLLGREAGVTLIVVLLALKMLELRARRDAFVVFFLGFFTLLTNFFESQSLLTAAAMLLGLLGLLTALVNAHMPVGKPPLLQAARTAAGMALLGAPIMLVLFLLFPRLAPLWGLPSDAMNARSGLSETMQVGNIAKLALDDSIALRIRFDAGPPPNAALYLRGPVLSDFDGREWRALRPQSPRRLHMDSELQVSGTPVGYEVTLEPSRRPWLLVLDATPTPPQGSGFTARQSADLQWLIDRPVTELLRYRAQSHLAFRHGPLQPVAGLQTYLALPPGLNPRTLQLGVELRRDVSDEALRVQSVLERLRNGGYRYTLEPGLFGQHSADEFWFERKQGFCEHIAASFVILMRASGVPARVVTGYQGGEMNALDGYFVVRQSDAHAWAEVWLSGRGWIRVDPTTAVAPGRTNASQRLLGPSSNLGDALRAGVSLELALRLRALWDATNNGWNQWILNYSQERQFDLLRGIGFAAPGWEDLSYLLLGIVVLASLSGAAWTRWERSRQDPWLRLLGRARLHLQHKGIWLAPNSPARTMAARLAAQTEALDPAATALQAWLLRLEAQRYAPGQGASLATLQREFNQLTQCP